MLVRTNRHHFVVFCLPFLVLYELRLKRAVKLGVYGAFSLGIINLAVSLIRFLVVQLGTAGGFINFPMLGELRYTRLLWQNF
jgi:hypothetical protein